MTPRTSQIMQLHEIRQLCRSMMEQQEDFLRLISDKLDMLEVDLSVSYAEEIEKGGDADVQ